MQWHGLMEGDGGGLGEGTGSGKAHRDVCLPHLRPSPGSVPPRHAASIALASAATMPGKSAAAAKSGGKAAGDTPAMPELPVPTAASASPAAEVGAGTQAVTAASSSAAALAAPETESTPSKKRPALGAPEETPPPKQVVRPSIPRPSESDIMCGVACSALDFMRELIPSVHSRLSSGFAVAVGGCKDLPSAAPLQITENATVESNRPPSPLPTPQSCALLPPCPCSSC